MTAKQEESVTQTEQFNLPPYFIFKGSEIINSSLPCMLLDDKSEDTDESKHRNDVLSSKIIYSMSKCRMLEKVIKFEEKDEPRNKENKTISYKMIADPDPSYQCILFENIAKNDSQNEVKASEEISIQENSVEDNVEPDEVLSNNEQNSDKMNVRLSYLVCFTSTLYLVSMIIAGALFRNECPVQPLLPYYPFVTGIIGLMVMILRTSMVLFGGYLNYHEYFSVIIMLMSVHHLLESTNDPDWFINIIMCARIFLLIWFVFANYWFWTIWNIPFKYESEKIYFNYDQETSYCNYHIYTFCLMMIISMYAMFFSSIFYHFLIVPLQEKFNIFKFFTKKQFK